MTRLPLSAISLLAAHTALATPLVLATPAASEETDTSSIPMITVDGGTFVRGAISGEPDERGTQTVTLSAFRIGATEVTRGQFARVSGGEPGPDADLPVTDVSWLDAVRFANAASALAGLDPVYALDGDVVTIDRTANGYRLPTEAEWEYAARGGALSEGFLFAGSDELEAVGWFEGNADGPRPVATLAANEFGLHDMSGNVWEWVWDVYAPYPAEAATDPAGPGGDGRRVSRGGSFAYDPNRARTTNRSAEGRHAPHPSASDLGFRLARNG